jgi:predicted RNase H-like HicB family nuclease
MSRREKLLQKMTTSHEYRGYVFTITYEPKDPAYSVNYPDVPDIITSGDSLAQAFANACEALDLHLESLQKLNLPLPAAKHRLVVQAAV